MISNSLSLVCAIGLFFTGCGEQKTGRGSVVAEDRSANTEKTMDEAPQNAAGDNAGGLFANIKTNKGTIKIKLEHEKAPMTVANFVALAEGSINNTFRGEGEPYFDGLTFHRVIADFMIQGGDPTGTGAGNPGYSFADEIHPDLRHDRAGVLSMANSGPATNGSQFFITHKETPWLDGKHAVFGFVVEGQDVVNAIAQGDKMEKVIIEAVGKNAKAFDAQKVLADNGSKFRAR